MLRLTARHANVWHSNAQTFDEAVALNKNLDAECLERGRDPASIRRSISMRLTTAEETLEKAQDALAAGLTELIVMIAGRQQGASRKEPRQTPHDTSVHLH